MCLILTVTGVLVTIVIARIIEFWLRRPYIETITDKYVFVTGCDTGFGNKLAKQLDTKGVHVIAACLTDKGRRDLDDVTSGRVKTLLLDVTDHDSVVKAYEEVVKIIPHQAALWGVVNNAGMSRNSGYLVWSRKEDYEKVLGVNLLGTVDVTLTFLPLLRKSSGRLVNVASCAGRMAAQPAGYCESKYAVEAFSDLVRRERKHFGDRFRVSIIEPGVFSTHIASKENMSNCVTSAWNRLSENEKEDFPESFLKKYIDEKSVLIDKLSSRDLSQVTDVMEHALFSKWPRTRYAAGWDAKLLWVPLSYCPTWFQDIVWS
nr:retinol dehydrogenase 7-like [Lytechinus pictus]